MLLFLFNGALALGLFFLVNWIGRHATDFGYAGATLFSDVSESVALNFAIRALGPTIFIVAVAAMLIGLGQEELRSGLYWAVVFYFLLRIGYILAWGRQLLVSWARVGLQVGIGIGSAMWAHQHLIMPKAPLLPNLQTAGNELWLAIFAFLYAVANKIQLAPGPSARRRNRYCNRKFESARQRYRDIVETKLRDPVLQLLAYSIIIYEDYSRPAPVRLVERLAFPRFAKTTGEMQVHSDRRLSDRESVQIGTDKLLAAWNAQPKDSAGWIKLRATISDYNKDDDYISNVQELMYIIVQRVAPEYEPYYAALWNGD